MRMYSLVSIFLTVFFVGTFAVPTIPPGALPPPPPNFENLPEECRPKRPEPGQEREVCCQIPNRSQDQKMTYMKECGDMLGFTPPGPPSGDGDRPPRPPGGPHCMHECLFNKMGYLTADMQLNSDVVSAKTIEEFGGDPAWMPIVEDAVRNCLQSAAGDVPADGICKSGAAEFHKCLMRSLYLNCPSGSIKNSESCTAERGNLERCPNLMPPPPPPKNN